MIHEIIDNTACLDYTNPIKNVFYRSGREKTMAIIKRAVASAANEKPANGVVKINSIEEPKAKQKAEIVAEKKDAAVRKAPAKKAAAPAKKAAEKKAAPAKKTEAKAPAKKSATAKPIEKKAPAKKPAAAAKKTTAAKAATEKKAPAKKPAAAAKKPAAAKTAAATATLTVQFNGRDFRKDDMDKAFEGVWTYDMGHKISEVKKVDYYFKPEESAVYFVVNDGTEGRFEI